MSDDGGPRRPASVPTVLDLDYLFFHNSLPRDISAHDTCVPWGRLWLSANSSLSANLCREGFAECFPSTKVRIPVVDAMNCKIASTLEKKIKIETKEVSTTVSSKCWKSICICEMQILDHYSASSDCPKRRCILQQHPLARASSGSLYPFFISARTNYHTRC